MTAATNAQRQAALKARRKAAGLVAVTQLWVHPDDVQKIKDYAVKLQRKRLADKVWPDEEWRGVHSVCTPTPSRHR